MVKKVIASSGKNAPNNFDKIAMSNPGWIPLLDLGPELRHMRLELDEAYRTVMDHGRFIMGPEVRQLEQEIARYMGSGYAVAVNSGTDALLIALRAAGIGPGDEVITTSFTFFATAESIEMAGAVPVFVDIGESDFNMDPDAMEKAVTSRTKAVVPVHLFGKPAAMARIMEIAEKYDLKVIEDCAQSFGAVYRGACGDCHDRCDPRWRKQLEGRQTGTLGQAGAFSFFPSKNLGGFGDGGMIITDDEALADTAAMLRVHGARKKYHNETLGYNSRLDTLQAAFLLVKLRHIEDFNRRRREVANRYQEGLSGLSWLRLPVQPDTGHVYHQYTVRIQDRSRDSLMEGLREKGIQTMIYYPVPCHKLPVYRNRNQTLDKSEEAASHVLSLPMGPFLSAADQQRVVDALHSM